MDALARIQLRVGQQVAVLAARFWLLSVGDPQEPASTKSAPRAAKNAPEDPKQDSKTMQLLARNEDRGVVVMTESASSHFDENKKRAEPPRRYTSIIHKIKEE